MIFSFSGVVFHSLIGYLDGVGLIPVMMLYLLLYKKKIQSLSVQDIIIMVILLISPAFLRRWYSYFVVSFFAAVFITKLIKALWDKQYGLKDFIRSVSKLFVIGVGCLLVLFLFFKSFILLSIRDVGKGVYEYNNHPPLDKFIEMFNYFGLITIILVLTGAVIGVAFKKTRYFAIFSILQSCFAYLLITSEQFMSPQHILLVSTGMMVLVFLNYNYVLLIKKRFVQFSVPKMNLILKLLLTLCLAMSTLFIANGYFVNLQTTIGKISVLPKHTEPRVNNDIDEIKEITEFLNSVSSPSKPVYVISGTCCYDDVFNNLYLPDQKNALNYLARSSYNDALGFPNLLLRSGFVVVVEPIVSNEMVVRKTAEYFLNGRFDNYSVIKTVNLVGNTKVTIFERMRPFSNSSLQALNEMQKEFFDRYPDKKELYKFLIIELIFQKLTLDCLVLKLS
uniref:JexA protein n=1 Tax=Paenibacillus jamilae TaxID=114136 RepID=Q3MSA6_9BACL|nr:JexA protein [Paenibacillus jamilae]